MFSRIVRPSLLHTQRACVRRFAASNQIGISEVKKQLRSLKLSVAGNKEELVARLTQATTPEPPAGKYPGSAAGFEKDITTLYADLSKGLLSMKQCNEGFEYRTEDKAMTIVLAKDREYKLEAMDEEECLSFTSPKSGNHTYKYDPQSGFFRSIMDDHIMIELFTRELISQCKGFPTF